MVRAEHEQMLKSLTERYEGQIRSRGDQQSDVESYRHQLLAVAVTNEQELRRVASHNDERLRQLANENNERVIQSGSDAVVLAQNEERFRHLAEQVELALRKVGGENEHQLRMAAAKLNIRVNGPAKEHDASAGTEHQPSCTTTVNVEIPEIISPAAAEDAPSNVEHASQHAHESNQTSAPKKLDAIAQSN